ncbi:MAG: carboxy terminal-processing peptidase [Desulfobacterales bacterium]|nr:carboxy terminal-processing peptidase [Desulfobacterales bacterium]
MKKLSFAVVFWLITPLFFSAPVTAQTSQSTGPLSAEEYYTSLAPLPEFKKTTQIIVANLKKFHYRELSLDDDLSSRLFDSYLNVLDRSRAYFTASDIHSLEKYRYLLDDALKTGKLAPVYDIYNLYQKRTVSRFITTVNTLEKKAKALDFTKDEYLLKDREKEPWPTSSEQLNDLWRRRLKNEILSRRLSDKKLPEITENLIKKYQSSLKRASQIRSLDVFRIFTNTFSELYDPHTQYFPPRASEDFNIHMSLSLEGIGALLQMEDEYTKVVRLVKAGPAEKSKLLKPGDRIIGVGQGDEEIVDVVGWRLDDVVQLIRGPKNTVVKLRIIPADSGDTSMTKVIPITRNTVKLEEQAASSKIIEIETTKGKPHKIGVVTIPTFYVDFNALQAGATDYKSTTRDVKKLIKELKKKGIDGLVIDLRDNGGGALKEASSLTGLFIDKGPTVLVRSQRNRVVPYPDPEKGLVYDGPLAVLVNRMSASASEIFAGAIKDYRRGLIIGTQTFGKGTVQSLINLKEGQLKLTIAKFYRVSGASTQNRGVLPDIAFPSEYNIEETGESSLPEALPWDTIRPVRYRPYYPETLSTFIAELDDLHKKRTDESAKFTYLKAYNTYVDTLRKRKLIPLNEAKRRNETSKSESFFLNLENNLRVAEGEKPYPSYDAMNDALKKEEKTTSEVNKERKENDTLLDETAHIVSDFFRLMSR